MKETRYFYVPDAANVVELPSEEADHAIKVLRLKAGDEMMLMDGCGHFFRAEISQVSGRRCLYNIIETQSQAPQWEGRVHLAIAPTKMNDRIEWFAEKATEVGVDELSFLNCQYSERRVLKTERVERIVVSAVKQSHKAYMPVVNGLRPFRQFINDHQSGHRYIAHCYEEVPRVNLFDQLCTLQPSDDALVMIGPEGDFSISEVREAVAAGYVSVDLGKSRLRTETAGLSAVMMMQLAKQIKNTEQL
jgi:16S rRNA (uracil1498-N3)-methyltransferase